jgi:hypothetical protein
MSKCRKCGSEMEVKGEFYDSGIPTAIFQCPTCKNVEFREKKSNPWFRLEYP